MFARVGIPHCPVCGREVVKQSLTGNCGCYCRAPGGSKLVILAPIIRGRKGTYQAVFEEIRKAGFVRSRVDGKVFNLDDEITWIATRSIISKRLLTVLSFKIRKVKKSESRC